MPHKARIPFYLLLSGILLLVLTLMAKHLFVSAPGTVNARTFNAKMMNIADRLGFYCQLETTRPVADNELPALNQLRAKLFNDLRNKKVLVGVGTREVVREFNFTNRLDQSKAVIQAFENNQKVYLVKVESSTGSGWKSEFRAAFSNLRILEGGMAVPPESTE